MTRNERSPLGKRRETASLFVRDDTVAESLSMPETTETLERVQIYFCQTPCFYLWNRDFRRQAAMTFNA